MAGADIINVADSEFNKEVLTLNSRYSLIFGPLGAHRAAIAPALMLATQYKGKVKVANGPQ